MNLKLYYAEYNRLLVKWIHL